MAISNAAPFFAAVVGDPVEHSLSPELFAHFSTATGRPLHYRKLRVPAGGLKQAFAKTEGEPWAGWNVTLPHKVAVMAFCAKLDPSAREAEAVNVLRFDGTEKTGFNTDMEGFLAPLKAKGFALAKKRALVFGAGGASRAVCAALKREGAADCVILNRTVERARLLAERFDFRFGSLEAAQREIPAADLVVNASAAGLEGKESLIPPYACFKKGALAYDLVYRPARTPFLAAASSGGAKTLGGLAMLAAQAAATWRLWFGETLDAAVVAAAADALQEKAL